MTYRHMKRVSVLFQAQLFYPLCSEHSAIFLHDFLICTIVFMYQALNMMITYASILCGVWHYNSVSHISHN